MLLEERGQRRFIRGAMSEEAQVCPLQKSGHKNWNIQTNVVAGLLTRVALYCTY